MPRKRVQDVARFWARVDRRADDECWPWTGRITREGYGEVPWHSGVFDGLRSRLAHRASWFFEHGSEAPRLVCHSCDNRRCVNPAHLWEGSDKDNQIDASRKGRQRGQTRTHCVNGHELTPDNTYWRLDKFAGRSCRACVNARQRARYARQKARVA